MKILHMGLSKAIVEALAERSITAHAMEPTGIEEVPDWIQSDDYNALVVVIDECSFGNVLPEFLRSKKIGIPLVIVARAYPHMSWSMIRADFMERGCDDVIADPVHPRELGASLRVIERRKKGEASDIVTVMYGNVPVVINLARSHVEVNGLNMRLSAQPLKVLLYLAVNRGRPVSRSELSQHIYLDRGGDARDTNTIEVFIGIIRRKLRGLSTGSDAVLRTQKGIGYVLDSVLEVAEVANAAA